MTVPGFTSTGSKRPEALFGTTAPAAASLPSRMVSARGCLIRDEEGRHYLDLIMALGAVTLGYCHPEVMAAAIDAVGRGGVGSLAPVEEERLAQRLRALLPWCERVRFLKTGAEAVAAAVRLARTHTGRDRVLGCGYHGWLDLAGAGGGTGTPAAIGALYQAIPFDDPERAKAAIKEVGDALAVVVVEPVIERAPSVEWLTVLREETRRVGAVLVYDEIKTGFRVALGGAVERWGREVAPDLVVYGKGLGNGFPIAAVAGRAEVMDEVARTWISSTLATEFVSLAAAEVVVEVTLRERFPEHAGRVGQLLLTGLQEEAWRYPDLVTEAFGIPEMSALRFRDEAIGGKVAAAMARRGVLFKRTAYNFVSLSHGDAEVVQALAALGEALAEVRQ
jgi:glutamate-1-semialdehyde 2,1-aminomutase